MCQQYFKEYECAGATHQIGLDKPDCSLGIKSVVALGGRLLCCLYFGKVLLDASELRENGVCLCVYTL